MSLRIGALFAGYGGLDMAVMDTLDADLAWYAEWDKAPAEVMAHHHPDVPNLWDVTKVDWAAVEPVDIITGGSPCQDLSHAGKRKGMTDGTRSNLWAEMREAIAVHRPRLVVWENVRGALSAVADSDMEPCPRCVGGAHDRGAVLRALGRVLGDLAELGYDARWYGLRAADVGGAHGRFRIFVIAGPTRDTDCSDVEGLRPRGVEVAHLATGSRERRGAGADADGGLSLLPTPTLSDTNGAGVHSDGGTDLRTTVALLPTPRATRGGSGTETLYGLGGERSDDERAQGVVLLPTPTTADHEASGARGYNGNEFSTLTDATVRNPQDWRQYEAAIRRAEHVTGRTAPAPTEPGAKGKPRLSPAFVEWLMMLPAGHVTDPAIGLTRNEQLKALGNGVVPAQAAAALRAYIRDEGIGGPVEQATEPPPEVLFPTPNAFHMGNTEEPDAWRNRRADVFRRTGTRHGPALPVVALSIAEGNPLVPANYMPEED